MISINFNYQNNFNGPKESPQYDFQSCVMSRSAELAGCRIPWDVWANTSLPICHNLEAANRYNKIYGDLAYSELKIITNISGCLTPCIYREYKVLGEPSDLHCTGG